MKRIYKSWLWLFALLLLLFLTKKLFYYKQIGYERVPDTVSILDERNYAHAGLTFRKTFIPTSWSNLGVYKQKAKDSYRAVEFNGNSITVNGNLPSLGNLNDFNYPLVVVQEVDVGKGKEQMTFVQPFMDHPLLGSIVYSLNLKSEKFAEIAPESYRKISLFVSALTGILIFIVTTLLTGKFLVGFLAFIFYSIAPSFLLSARLALLENLIIPLFLLNFLFLILFKEKIKNPGPSFIFLLLSGVFSGLAFSTKEQGIFVLIGSSLILLLVYKVKIKSYLVFISAFIVFGCWSYLYYLFIGKKFYLDLFLNQTQRGFFGPLNIVSSINGLHFNNFPLDGFWLWGLVSLLIYVFQNKKSEIAFYLGSFLLILLFTSGANYPWYYLPLIPLMAICSASLLYKFFCKPSLFLSIVFFIFPFSSALHWGFSPFRENSQAVLVYKILLLVFIFAGFILPKITFLSRRVKKNLWHGFVLAVFYQTYEWSCQGILYLVENWEKLPRNLVFFQF